jgi:alpha-1,3-rhamnosyltransferase
VPQVSVIIASYNHAAFVETAVRSVLGQSWPATELIVLDDGSTDGSAALLDALSTELGFTYRGQANQGLSATLNRGVAMARGEYVALLGSDDLMLPDRLEKQVALLERRPDVAICAGNALVIDGEGTVVRSQRMRPYRELDFDDVFLFRKHHPLAPTLTIRRCVLQHIGGFDPELRLEDLDIFLRITRDGHRIAVLNDVLSYYRKHGANTSGDYRYMTEQTLRTFSRFRDHPHYEAAVNRYLSSMFLHTADRDKRLAFEILLKLNPRHYNRRVWRGALRLAFIPSVARAKRSSGN